MPKNARPVWATTYTLWPGFVLKINSPKPPIDARQILKIQCVPRAPRSSRAGRDRFGTEFFCDRFSARVPMRRSRAARRRIRRAISQSRPAAVATPLKCACATVMAGSPRSSGRFSTSNNIAPVYLHENTFIVCNHSVAFASQRTGKRRANKLIEAKVIDPSPPAHRSSQLTNQLLLPAGSHQ